MKPACCVVLALCLASVARADPPVPQVHERLRQIESAILRGEVGTVRIKLQEEARNRPGDVLLRVYLAWCEMPSDDAWNALKGIASIYPDHAWTRLGMGRIYLKWGMRDQAETEFAAALKRNPRFYPALVGQGHALRMAKEWDQAIARYQAALKIQDDPEAHAGLGFAWLQKKDPKKAKAAFARAVALWPDQPKVLAELARLCREEGDLAKAAEWTEKLLELNPRDGEARRRLGELQLAAGQKTAAAKSFERAARLGVVDAALFRQLAEIYREAKDVENERRALEQLSALEKKDPAHPLRLAELARSEKDFEGAEAQLLEALDRTPARADVHLRLARLRVERGNLREALEAYRDAAARAGDQKPEGLEKEAAALVAQFHLPKRPVKGGVEAIYGRVARSLDRLYRERLKADPKLAGGWLKIRVRVDAAGKVLGADVLEDSVGDPYLAGHAYFSLLDADFPKRKREPVFEFELQPPRGRK